MLLLVEGKMHKSELQELCQRNVWRLPEYSNSRDGPDHEPCFSSIVTVNGVSFQSSTICRTVKAAQNNAAEIAFNHFSGSGSAFGFRSNDTSGSVLPTSQNGLEATLPIQPQTENVMQPPITPVGVNYNKNSDGQLRYKNRLLYYAQKRNIGFPVYSSVRQGPPHASQFKCGVTFGGQNYEGTNFFFTLKEAENDAAKIALEHVSPNEDQEDDSAMYKSLLQELAQKRGLLLPSYETKGIGTPYIPVFVATVKVGDKVYQGLSGKNKKQAEINAAKSAYDSLRDGSLHLNEQHMQNGCTKENLQTGTLQLNEHLQNGCSKENLQTGILHLTEQHQQNGCTKENLQMVLPTSQNGLEATLPIQSHTGDVMQPPIIPVGVKDNKNLDGQLQYKNQLQYYAQKRNIGFPVYSSVRQGPPHASQFKCRVTVDGQNYEGTNFFFTLKEAENDVAKIALEQVSPNEDQEDDSAMYKNLLQELAQKRGIMLPSYETKGIGKPHIPVFVTTVKVGDKVYQGLSEKNKKRAEISAAKSAYDSLRDVLPTSQNGLQATLPVQSHTGDVMQPPLTPVGVPDNKNSDGQLLYKNRLQHYAQKRNIGFPVYSFVRQGPPHASQFKCRVTVGGQSYEGTNFFFTLKEAENDAAKIAFEQVSPNEHQEDDSAIYKNLLQEWAQKRGFLLPSYETKGIGGPQSPVFVATVKVGDKVYQGLSAKNKKQAEMSAAKSAYGSLQDGTLHLNEQHQQNGFIKENLQMGPLHLNEQHQQNVSTKEILQMGSLHVTEQHQQNVSTEENLQMATKAMKCEIQLKNPCVSKEIKEEAILSDPTTKSTENGFNDPSPMHQQTTFTDGDNNLPPNGTHMKSDNRVYQKIMVCPRSMMSNVLESGIASDDVTYRDDNWVALKMNTNL